MGETKLKLVTKTDSINKSHMTTSEENIRREPIIDVSIDTKHASKNRSYLITVIIRKRSVYRLPTRIEETSINRK